jgi:hypothetical protein
MSNWLLAFKEGFSKYNYPLPIFLQAAVSASLLFLPIKNILFSRYKKIILFTKIF